MAKFEFDDEGVPLVRQWMADAQRAGPPPYAMTDANQAELSDRWQAALTIRDWIEKIWTGLG
jgi:hypothetical protein